MKLFDFTFWKWRFYCYFIKRTKEFNYGVYTIRLHTSFNMLQWLYWYRLRPFLKKLIK